MKMSMKKIYVIPNTMVVYLRAGQPLASNSLEVHDKASDPVVDSSDQVYSRRKDHDVWEEDDDTSL